MKNVQDQHANVKINHLRAQWPDVRVDPNSERADGGALLYTPEEFERLQREDRAFLVDALAEARLVYEGQQGRGRARVAAGRERPRVRAARAAD